MINSASMARSVATSVIAAGLTADGQFEGFATADLIGRDFSGLIFLASEVIASGAIVPKVAGLARLGWLMVDTQPDNRNAITKGDALNVGFILIDCVTRIRFAFVNTDQ